MSSLSFFHHLAIGLHSPHCKIYSQTQDPSFNKLELSFKGFKWSVLAIRSHYTLWYVTAPVFSSNKMLPVKLKRPPCVPLFSLVCVHNTLKAHCWWCPLKTKTSLSVSLLTVTLQVIFVVLVISYIWHLILWYLLRKVTKWRNVSFSVSDNLMCQMLSCSDLKIFMSRCLPQSDPLQCSDWTAPRWEPTPAERRKRGTLDCTLYVTQHRLSLC